MVKLACDVMVGYMMERGGERGREISTNASLYIES